MNIIEQRLDELIENCELRPQMYFLNNLDFLACYSYFMYLKFGGNVSIIEEKLQKHLNINIEDHNRLKTVFNKSNFQEDIKIFRRTLENMIFE